MITSRTHSEVISPRLEARTGPYIACCLAANYRIFQLFCHLVITDIFLHTLGCSTPGLFKSAIADIVFFIFSDRVSHDEMLSFFLVSAGVRRDDINDAIFIIFIPQSVIGRSLLAYTVFTGFVSDLSSADSLILSPSSLRRGIFERTKYCVSLESACTLKLCSSLSRRRCVSSCILRTDCRQYHSLVCRQHRCSDKLQGCSRNFHGSCSLITEMLSISLCTWSRSKGSGNLLPWRCCSQTHAVLVVAVPDILYLCNISVLIQGRDANRFGKQLVLAQPLYQRECLFNT